MKNNFYLIGLSKVFDVILVLILNNYQTLGQNSIGQTNTIIPICHNIPGDGETINETSYIVMTADICSEPGGQVLIYDEVSNQQLLRFSNRATSKICNNWQQNYESFVSDSNKVRIELVLPFGEIEGNEIEESGGINFSPITDTDTQQHGDMTINYKGFKLKLIYFEMHFISNGEITLDSRYTNNTIAEALYVPNSVLTFKLISPQSDDIENKVLIGVQISLEFLDIDIDSGDFLLIGPGSETTPRELSKDQIIYQNVNNGEEPTNIWVNADSAYIRLVTHNSLKKTETALRFSWSPPNTTVDDIDNTKVSDRIKNSALQICILDTSCQKMSNAFKEQLTEELVHIANDYLTNEYHDFSNLVSKRQVLLFNSEEGIRMHTDSAEIFCQTNLAITSAYDDQWPMVSYNTLLQILFGNSNYKELHSFGTVRITDCSHDTISFWKMILPIVIIIIVSLLIMLMAWRYQYNNWMSSQRLENAKYMKTQVNDNNEDTLFKMDTKNNPLFIEVEPPLNIRKTNLITKTTDFTDGNFIINNERNYNKQISQTSESSEVFPNQPIVNNEQHLEDSSWVVPSTSQHLIHQKPTEYDSQMQQQIPDNNQLTRDIPNINIADRSLSSASDTIPSRVNTSITGLHGTQHESLRAYPRSVLRRPRTASENEYVIGPESSSLRLSKVQFELPLAPQPKRSPLIKRDSSGSASAYENIVFEND